VGGRLLDHSFFLFFAGIIIAIVVAALLSSAYRSVQVHTELSLLMPVQTVTASDRAASQRTAQYRYIYLVNQAVNGMQHQHFTAQKHGP
jgi:hypothetical protein